MQSSLLLLTGSLPRARLVIGRDVTVSADDVNKITHQYGCMEVGRVVHDDRPCLRMPLVRQLGIFFCIFPLFVFASCWHSSESLWIGKETRGDRLLHWELTLRFCKMIIE